MVGEESVSGPAVPISADSRVCLLQEPGEGVGVAEREQIRSQSLAGIRRPARTLDGMEASRELRQRRGWDRVLITPAAVSVL